MLRSKLKPNLRTVFDHIVSIIAALVVVFFLRSSFYESYKIPSGSMIPTILIGDHVFVNKFAYALNLPFSEYFGDPVRLFNRAPPKLGDIIVFESPRNPEINYIKRVVASGGDIIRVRDRRLFINDKEIFSSEPSDEERKEVFGVLLDPKLDENGMRIMKEHLGEIDHWVMLDKNNFVSENFGPYEVPADRVFVLGDNRDFSDDSRFIGAIPVNKVRGRAGRIWLSIWIHFNPGEFEFHPLRTGKSLYSL